MTLPLLRVIRNSFAFRSENCTHFGRHCKSLRSESRYSEWGQGRARGACIGAAVGSRVHSVTRSLRYFSVARPTFTILKEKVTMPENKPFQRLPKCVVPKHYNLELVPNLEKFTFTGKTAVKVSVRGNFIISLRISRFHRCICDVLKTRLLSDREFHQGDSAQLFRFGADECKTAVQ